VKSLAEVPASAAIKATGELKVARLDADYAASFPDGSAADAESEAQADGHLFRLEAWRSGQLDSDLGTKTPYEMLRKEFTDARTAFDRETERLKAMHQLTPEQAEMRKDPYREYTALIVGNGPLQTFYRKWFQQWRTAKLEWDRRRDRLRKLSQ